MPANISAGGRTAPAEEDGLAAQFMCENARAATCHCKLRVDVGGESAFRDREDDGIGAFYWSDEGFGYAIGANADRALLLPLGGDRLRQTAGWRQSQTCAGTREGQLALITAGWPLTKILQDPQRANDAPSFSLSASPQPH